MQVLDDRSVLLTDTEMLAYERFQEILDAGHGMEAAAKLLLAQYPASSAAFLDWLVN